MILRLRLRHWRSHVDTSMEFGRGVNALVGIMGAGKSSVMDAISFALFGTFPALSARRLTLEELIMDRPHQQNEARVELAFLVDGKEYTVSRTISRSKGSAAEFREDGVLREVSPKGATREVERVLRMDYELFSRAVYAEQNGLDFFLKIPAGKRREHVDRLLRLDRFETVRTQTVSLRTRIAAGLSEKHRLLADLEREGIPQKLAEALDEGKKQEAELARIHAEEERIKEEKRTVEDSLRRAEQQERARLDAERLLHGTQGALDALGAQEAKNRTTIIGKDLGKLALEIQALDSAVRERREERDGFQEDFASVEAVRNMLIEQRDRLNTTGEACPICDTPLPLPKRQQMMTDRDRRIRGLDADLLRHKLLISEKEQELVSIEDRLGQKRLEHDRVSSAFRELRDVQEKVQQLLATRKRYEEVISTTPPADSLPTLRHQMTELISRERELWVENRSIQFRLDSAETKRKELTKRMDVLELYQREAHADTQVSQQLDVFENVLRETQDDLRTAFLEHVNMHLSRTWNDLYPYGDFTDARVAIVDGDYALQLRAQDWMDIERLSGGERSLACLALRVAFSLAFLPELRWLILDEPTHNLDEQAIRMLAEAMHERLPSVAEQVFLVTHDPALAEGMQRVYRLERDKAAFEATRVVRV